MKKHSYITEDFEDRDFKLDHEPTGEVLKAKIGDKIVMSYLTYDTNHSADDMGDCMGELISFHRHAPNHDKGLAALGKDRHGEPDLDAIWRDHQMEVEDRYIKMLLETHGVADLLEEYDSESVTTEADLVKRLRDGCRRNDWSYVEHASVMEAVLYGMWNESEFFPGDRDAVMLDCYDHGGQVWSISGSGMQCRWDTARGAGVWIPDRCLKEELDSSQAGAVYAIVERTHWVRGTGRMFDLIRVIWRDELSCEKVHVRSSDDASELHKEAAEIRRYRPEPSPLQLAWGREQMCRIYCEQFLDEFNAIISGDVYGCITQVFDESGDEIDSDSCWGFVGSEYAEEALLHEMFEPMCETQKAKYEEECRTACGKQLELEL